MKFYLILMAVTVITGCNNQTTEPQVQSTSTTSSDSKGDIVKQGAYLVLVGGCNDCHSPKNFGHNGPMLDTTKTLSGHPAGEKLPPVNADATKPGNWIQMAPDLTAYAGPWGISYAANLTPDSATGIGAWNETNFINALHTGKHLGHPDGRDILPPMPWQEIGHMKDEDLKAIYAYLRSLPPVTNKVPAPVAPNEVGTMK